jgi:hypothetical protein
MSISPDFQPGAGATGGISDVVSQDDLTRFAQIAGVLRWLTAPLDPPPPPETGTPIAPTAMKSVFRNTYAALAQAGVDNALAHQLAAQWGALAGSVGHLVAVLVQGFSLALEPVAAIILGALDGLRKGFDPQLGDLGALVLNEFLGTEYGDQNMAHGLGVGDHLSRARSVGGLLFNQLEREFAPAGGGPLVPSSAPAQTFSGLAINFGMASSIMGALGACVPILHLDELRELGEDVATNIGLGRLVRRALTPLIQILVAQPLTWALNTKYLPTQFKEAELVNPYLGATLPHDQLYNAMHLLGYSDDKIQAFIQMHQKRLNPAEVKLLVDNNLWSQQDGLTYISNLGYPAELAGTIMTLEDIREEKGWVDKFIAELETDVVRGVITTDEFESLLNGAPGSGAPGVLTNTTGLPLSQHIKDLILSTVTYKVAAGKRTRAERLSEGELMELFEAGLLTASDLNTYWTARGLPDADQNLRMQLILLRLSRAHHLAAEKQQHYQAQLRYFVEKQAAKPTGAPPPVQPIAPFPLGT